MNRKHFEASARRLANTRRHFFGDCSVGLGGIALASLLGSPHELASAAEQRGPLAPRAPHFPPKAKNVIHLYMAGAPSHLELFDNKPKLAELEGKPLPPEVIGDQRYAFIRSDAAVLGPRFKFQKHGDCGAELSEVLPHLAGVVDDLAFIKSMNTDQFNHAPGQLAMTTGFPQPGRPCIGAWVTYGIGSEAEDLPAFVVLSTGGGTSAGTASWSSGFMPGVYSGVPFRSQGDPILDVSSPKGVDSQTQRESIELIRKLNERQLEQSGDTDIETRIASYEMAYRLQTSAPELMDIGSEPKRILDMYGAKPGKTSFANNCLLARRLVERGVRFVNVFHKGWDAHSNVEGNHRNNCKQVDQPAAALIKDLKQRGLLDETLVVWGGEFGRTPMIESNPIIKRKQGRDHHPQAFTIWMAGGGVKGGVTYGKTDELGFHVIENKVPVRDLHATILHLLGLDHKRLRFNFRGLDFRLTGVDEEAHVIRDVLV